MKVVALKCPNCGANLDSKKLARSMKCEYCGSSIMASEEQQELINAELLLNKIKDYDSSYEIYKSLLRKYADHPELWIGILRSFTKDFTYKEYGDKFAKEYQKYWRGFIALASEDEVKKYQNQYRHYVDCVRPTNMPYEMQFEQSLNTASKSLDEFLKKGNKIEEIVIVVFFGMFGVHKFMNGEIGMGILYFCTGGLFGIGWIYDIIKTIEGIDKK